MSRTRQHALKDFHKPTLDNSALSTEELGKLLGIHQETARKKVRKLISEGLWEMVYKRSGRQVIPAYRRKRT